MKSDRLSFRVESFDGSPQVKGPKPEGFANDSVVTAARKTLRGSYLKVPDLERIISGLNERDRSIIESIEKLRYVTTVQIQRLFFVNGTEQSNSRRARLVLRRLTDLRLLDRLERRVGGARAGSTGLVYCLDIAGHYLVRRGRGDRRRRPSEPSPLFLEHTLAISELYTRLVEADRGRKLELVEFETEPRCWRDFFGSGGARITLKPDAFVRVGRGEIEDLWFIEIDRATHAVPALLTKFRTYRQYWTSGQEQQRWDDTFPRVLWLGPASRRVRKLIDVVAKQPAEARELFVVRLYEEAVSTLTPEVAE